MTTTRMTVEHSIGKRRNEHRNACIGMEYVSGVWELVQVAYGLRPRRAFHFE